MPTTSKKCLSVAVLEPYYGGSHAAFVNAIKGRSRHKIQLVTLPARKWKWRMRGAALWFAYEDSDWQGGHDGRGVDAILCNDMLSVSDLKSLLPDSMRNVPIVCYFHENQLTYPMSPDDERDFQYGMTNISSCLASDAVWFNSAFHRDDFLNACGDFLKKMPDHVPADLVQHIRNKSAVYPPPVDVPGLAGRVARAHGNTTRILWSHRWEYDKNPEPFFQALIALHDRGVAFELVLLGEQFRTAPQVFRKSWPRLEPHIVHTGFVPDRHAYWEILTGCDLVVSSAIQENFGISVVEAVFAGCRPLLPDRLSYPELIPPELHATYLYKNNDSLFGALQTILSEGHETDGPRREKLRNAMKGRYGAGHVVRRIDDAIEKHLA